MSSKLIQCDASFCLPVRPTAEDIRNGTKLSFDSCPIAYQIQREVKNRFRRWRDTNVRVTANFVTIKAKIGKDEEETTFVSPVDMEARQFIGDFDKGKVVDPGYKTTLTFRPDA